MRPSTVMRMEIELLLISVNQTAQIIGRSVAHVYDLLGSNQLEARKSNSRTLVTMDSIREYVAKLPKAQIAPRPVRKPQRERQTEISNP